MNWQLSPTPNPDSLSPQVIAAARGSRLLAQLLLARGINTPEAMTAFLDLEHYEPTLGSELPDMDVAIARLRQAIDAQEPILVWGDFDVDGQTGTSILVDTLKKLGAKVSFYIPDRATEGHGMHAAPLMRLVSSRKLKLVITTDTGIGDFTEISLLQGLGVDTIVTDHHELPEVLPPAVANVTPRRLDATAPGHPLQHLSGAGVAYKVAEALLTSYGRPQADIDALLDLAAIGLVADVMNLTGENRYIVWRGLQVIASRQRLGLAMLLERAGQLPEKPVNAETVGFMIGPRLNALGRLAQAEPAVALLTGDDASELEPILDKIEALNKRRQALCDETFEEAEKALNRQGGLGANRGIVLASPEWHVGIVGIVANRLADRYGVPTFLMCHDEGGGKLRCSARSAAGFALHEGLAQLGDAMFEGWGGHAGAAGFTLLQEKFEPFKTAILEVLAAHFGDNPPEPTIQIDAELEADQLHTGLVDLLAPLGPFGQGNPAPVFLLKAARLGALRRLGNTGKHLKLIVTPKGSQESLDVLCWQVENKPGALLIERERPQTVDLVFKPELNSFNGNTSLQLILQDIRTAGQGNVPRQAAPLASANPVKTAQAALTAPQAKKAASNGQAAAELTLGGPNWQDARPAQNEAYQQLTGRLMRKAADGSLAVYHEGRPPKLAMADRHLFTGRLLVTPANTLVLWDLPPDLATLQAVLNLAEPEDIILCGGKYEEGASLQGIDPQEMLNWIWRLSARCIAEEDGLCEVDSLASRLATSETVICRGLALLQQSGHLMPPEVIEPAPLQLRLASGPAGSATDFSLSAESRASLAWQQFDAALDAVATFRQWLATAELATIRTFCTVSLEIEKASSPTHDHGTRPESLPA